MIRLLRAGHAGLVGAALVGWVRSDVASAMPRRDDPPPGAVSGPLAQQPRSTGAGSSAGGPAGSSAGGPAAPDPLAPGDIPSAFQRMLMTQEELHAHAAAAAPRLLGLFEPPPAGLKCGEWQPLYFMGDCATAQANAICP
jgi:hypothetical protein